MRLDVEVGRVAITELNAAGSNPREGAAFLVAQAEVDKLNSINSQSAVDWEKVASSCCRVLGEEGKDLAAAVWLLCAWFSLHGVSGLVGGANVLRGLLERYWSELTPPLSRLRARRGQVNWMLDWLDVKLGEVFEPVPEAQLARLLEDWDEIDSFWRECDAEGPGFFRLRRRLAGLPVEVTVVSEEVLVEPDVVPQVIPVEPIVASPVAPLSPVAPQVTPVEGSESEVFERAVNDTFSVLRSLIEPCLQRESIPLLLLRINRQMAWISLEDVPVSQGGVTRLPPPPRSQLEAFALVQAGGDSLGVVRFCEARLPAYPYWLDLNRVSHAALSCLGAEGAAGAASLELEVRHLLARLPVLAELKFKDGQPFADGATRSWLESLVPVVRADVDAIQILIDDAGREAASGQLGTALQCLQERLSLLGSGRDRFRLRRAQCELLHRFDPLPQLQVVLNVLLQEAQAQALDRWEPELVRPLLELTLLYRDDGSKVVWSEQLAAMDLPAFWRLAGTR